MPWLARRVLLGALAKIALVIPITGLTSARSAESEEFVIVNGWILKSSDLRGQHGEPPGSTARR